MTGTHILETAEGAICQNTERSDPLPGDHTGENVSGQKKNDQVKGTHKVEIAEGGMCHDTERKRLSEGYSPIRQFYATVKEMAGLCMSVQVQEKRKPRAMFSKEWEHVKEA